MKFIEDNLSKEWYEEFAEGSPVLVGLPAQAINQGIISSHAQYQGLICFYFQNKLRWYTLVEDQDKIAQEILQNYLKDKNHYRRWFSRWQIKNKKFENLFEKLVKTNLVRVTDQNLFAFLRTFWIHSLASRRISMLTDPFMFGIERIFARELQSFTEKNKINNFSKLYASLTLPEKSSFMNDFELDLIRITKRIKKEQKVLLLKNPAKLSPLSYVKRHLQKYVWIRGNWGHAYPYTIQDLVEEIRELLDKNLDRLEKQKKSLDKIYRAQRITTLRKYLFPKKLRSLSDLSAFFAYWHDLRKISALKYIYGLPLLLKEFSRRFDLEEAGLYLFDPTELEKVIKSKKKFIQEVRKREKFFMLVYKDKKVYPFYGNVAKKYYGKFTTEDLRGIKEIRGMCASGGKARGRVKIIHEKKEFAKFQKGEILVTGMTRPEFVPLMKKAAAIVTNDGGITCHAAIISRELHKPCIIGTRIATKVLKDGDKIEVDANKGIVRKI